MYSARWTGEAEVSVREGPLIGESLCHPFFIET